METKRCSKCGMIKSVEEFYKRNDKYIAACKKCSIEQKKIWVKNNPDKVKANRKKWVDKNPNFRQDWKENNPEKYKESQDKYRKSNEKAQKHQKEASEIRRMNTTNFIVNYKESIGCLNPACCWKGDYIACMLDFHHLDPATKELTLSKCGFNSREKIIEEIKKCTILCSNCHRLVTKKILDDKKFPLCKIESNIDYSVLEKFKLKLDVLFNIFKKTAFNHFFELNIAELHKQNKITVPIYLSIGTEHVAAVLSEFNRNLVLFPQHRCHSYYLSFGGSPLKLIKELLGSEDGCNEGMGGSASISVKNRVFGHNGLLGSNYPISAGFCFSTNKPTAVIIGDGAAEQDEVLSSLGFVSTKKIPLLTIVEDNNLSILTKRETRRSWDIVEVAKGFDLEAVEIDDDPETIYNTIQEYKTKLPALINIKVCRHCWHCGSGQDGQPEWNRYELFKNDLLEKGINVNKIEIDVKNQIEEIMKKL